MRNKVKNIEFNLTYFQGNGKSVIRLIVRKSINLYKNVNNCVRLCIVLMLQLLESYRPDICMLCYAVPHMPASLS